MADERSKVRRGFVRTSHVVGNILLGFAIGLASYYGITDVLASRAQSGLQESLGDLGSIAIANPPLALPESDEWSGWDDQDRAYWTELEEGGVFGRLVIESIGVDSVVVKGTEREDLQKGPGWIVQTDLPGPTGNVGISGHRTTYGAPFRDIDQLIPGDRLVLYSPFRRYVYEVTGQLVVTPDEVWVVDSTEDPQLTLTACHPPYSAEFRIIVQSRLVEAERLEGEVPDV
jgi:LPXTG-site transpeptidase (sortase) family protein